MEFSILERSAPDPRGIVAVATTQRIRMAAASVQVDAITQYLPVRFKDTAYLIDEV